MFSPREMPQELVAVGNLRADILQGEGIQLHWSSTQITVRSAVSKWSSGEQKFCTHTGGATSAAL